MKRFCFLWIAIFLTCAPLVRSQDLLFLDGIELTLTDSTALHVEGGVLMHNNGVFRNNGDLYVGTNGSGYVPLEANWTVNQFNNGGNLLEAEGRIHLVAEGITQEIQGQLLPVFTHLVTKGTVRLQRPVRIFRSVLLESGHIDLNRQRLLITRADPQAIQRVAGHILAETHFTRDGGYGEVIWAVDGALPDAPFTIPFGTREGVFIPLSFSLSQPGINDVRIGTFPTDPQNLPLPVNTGFGSEIRHMQDALGQEAGTRFIDRFWVIDSDENRFNRLQFSYAPGEVTGEIPGREAELRGQVWGQGSWNYMNLGQLVQPGQVLVEGAEIPSGIWSLSLEDPNAPVTSRKDPLDLRGLSIVPNPSPDRFEVQVQLARPGPVSLTVYDMQGRVILTRGAWGPAVRQGLNLDGHPQGVYLMQVNTPGGAAWRRLVKTP